MAKEPFAARLTCIWIGGFVIWLFKGCRGKLRGAFTEKYDSRNFWVGYAAIIISIVGFLVFVVINEMRR